MVGRADHQSSYPDDVEVPWRLAHEHWGKGYATEASTAWLDQRFGTLGFPRIISITEVFDAVIYSITAGSWRALPRKMA